VKAAVPTAVPADSRRLVPSNSVSRTVIVTLLVSAAATLAAALIDKTGGTGSAVSVYMLAVVIASIMGGIPAGLGTAGIASIALVTLFSGSRGTASPDQTADLIATLVFLAVAIIVGLLVASAVHERALATRREREAQFLGSLAAQFLSGDVPERALDDFSAALLAPLGLVSCRIEVTLDGVQLRADAHDPGGGLGGHSQEVALAVGDVTFGTLTAVRPAGARPMSRAERLLLESAARQASAALERARLDAKVRHAQLEAETNQLRAAMFSSVTHDLRTPLASIMAGVTSLLDESAVHDHAQQRELLVTIREETDRLNRLVGNIMNLAKIRAGALIPAREPTAIDEIVEAVLQRLRPRLETVTIHADLPAELHDALVDPVQMDQVLTNLLENAARYAPPGSQVDVKVAALGPAIRVRVSDRGPGIPEEDRERVFEAFYRGRTGPERPGSGLGLAIVRAIISAHGGRVWIEAPAVGGTTVVFDVPVDGEDLDPETAR
jgi:two-component system sensor histidine kinase KdpD